MTIQATINIMGEIEVNNADGLEKYPLAMLITFKTAEDLRQAFNDEQVSITFD